MTSTLSARSDARRNRARLVEAARELFEEAGVDVSVRELAARAGVGVATIYRHFGSREELVDAVLQGAFEEMVEVAQQALAEDDAWDGFVYFIERALTMHARNRGLRDVFETQVHGRERAASMRRQMRPLVERLVARAQAEGALRPDFTPQDIQLIIWGSDRVIELGSPLSPEIWRRHLGFVLDGLRPSAATPLPAGPLTAAQLRRAGNERQ